MVKEKYCDFCERLIGVPGKIYIAGSTCYGHEITLLQFIIWKIKKLFNKN